MWFTLDNADSVILPSMSSAPFKESLLKGTQEESDGTTYSLRIPSIIEIRLRQGLFVTVALDSREIRFSPGNLERMKLSDDRQVKAFRTAHAAVLENLAASGTELGFYRSLKPNRVKAPFPCKFHWSVSQMYETTPNTQQCVRMIIGAAFEFFFVMTDSISDFHQFIYVHQTRTSLCLHRLSEDTTEDELNVCAENDAGMDALGTYTELYVCTNYLKERARDIVGISRHK